MRKSTIVTVMISCAGCLILGSCRNKSSNVWDDSGSTMGSYKRPKERVLWGSNEMGETALVEYTSSASNDDFVPLDNDDLKQQFSELVFAQPKDSPGEEGSALPGIDGFRAPTGSLAQIFKNVYFNTDEYTPKDGDSSATLQKIAGYLKENPDTYVFVTGNCDQRGSESYNLPLGSKRANSIRSLLIKQGVNGDQIYTISYGKERLADPGNTPDAWAKNRRAEFKIFVKR